MPTLHDPLTFTRGPAMANRFMLAPLTNWQSHADGTLDERLWASARTGAYADLGLPERPAEHLADQGPARRPF